MASVNYEVQDPQGNSYTSTDAQLGQMLAEAGQPVTGTTPDGLNAVMQNPGGKKGEDNTVHVPLQAALEQQGWKVKSVKPLSPVKDDIDPWLSAKLQSYPDESLHKPYLADRLSHVYGIENPKIIGSGNEYHVFDDQAHQWHQITEEPKWNNLTGLLSAGLAIPHLAGMGMGATAGGTAGTALGGPVGGFAGGAAGAAAGSALGESLRQRGIGAFDPDYDRQLDRNPDAVLSGIGKTAGLDAASQVGAGILGAGGRWALGTKPGRVMAEEAANAMQVPGGFVSKLAKGISGGVEKAGAGLKDLGGFVAGNDLAKEAATQMSPLGPITSAAELAGSPSWATRGLAEVAAGLPENKWLNWMVPEETAAKIGAYGKGLLEENAPRTLGERGTTMAEEAANAMGAQNPRTYRTSDVMHNWVNRMKNKGPAEEAFEADPDWQLAAQQQDAADRHVAKFFGTDADKLAQFNRDAMKKGFVDRTLRQTATEPNWGGSAGRVMEGVEDAAGAVRDTARGAVGATARGVQGLGALGQAAGYVGKNAATLASPLELPAEIRYGLPKIQEWWEDRKQKR